MKNPFIIALATAVLVPIGYVTYKNNKSDNLDENQIANIEALAAEEYVIGSTLTNWKTYRIKCTHRDELNLGFVSSSTEYEYWVDACGKGTGLCFSLPGC
jgi:hypothetical protein